MQISELRIRQGNVNVSGIVKEIVDSRSFVKYGRELKVAHAILEDDSGSIKLTLWNDDVTRINEGDKIKVNNGFVNEFQGEKQLTAGKFGNIEIVEKASSEEVDKVEERNNESEEGELIKEESEEGGNYNEEVF